MASKKAASEPSSSDDAVKKATGRVWSEWFAYIDKWAKPDHTHKQIAEHLASIGVRACEKTSAVFGASETERNGGDLRPLVMLETHLPPTERSGSEVFSQTLPPWWSQTVTVEWERRTGRRVANQTTRGFEVGVSRTLDASAEECEKHFLAPGALAKWMGKGAKASLTTKQWADPHGSGTITSANPGKRICVAWTPTGTERKEKLEIQFLPTKSGKTSVRITHTKLEHESDVERRRADWAAALDRLAKDQ